MMTNVSYPVFPRHCALALLAISAVWFVGCNESVVPAPTGQLDSTGSGPQAFSNDVPRTDPGPPIFGGATGAGPSESHAAATSSSDAGGATSTGNLGTEFYEVAKEAGSGSLTGSAVEAEVRDQEAVDKASAAYPELAAIDGRSAESRPAPDPNSSYEPIVDPDEGKTSSYRAPVELSVAGADIESVKFSSAAAGQAIVASRQSPSGQPIFTRLERYDLATGKRVSSVDLPDRAALLDVTPDGTRALVRLAFGLAPKSRPVASQTRLDVWELTEAEGQHIVGWQPGADGDQAPSVPLDAGFLNGNRVVSLTDEGRLTLWDFVERKAVYVVDTGSRGPLLMTPGRKYVAVFTGTTFGAFDAADGMFRGLLTPPRPTLAACSDAAFSPDGKQLAAVLRRPAQSLLTWDVAAGRPASEIEAQIALGRGIHFGSPGYVVAGGVLFDIDRKKPVWLYLENPESKNVESSIDRRHWIVSRPAFRKTTLQSVEAPTDAVIAATRSVPSLAATQLSPGDDLAVELELVGFSGDQAIFEADLARSLGRVLDARGLRLDANADAALKISVSDRRTGERIGFNAIGPGSDETVPAHEVDFTVSLLGKSGGVLWSGFGTVPPSYFLAKQEGKTLEQVLVEALWQSVPAAIADELERTMPSYVRTTPPEATLGQTRLWVAADDVSPPGGSQVTADATGTNDVESAPAVQPSMMLGVGPTGVQDLAVASSGWLITTNDDGAFRTWQPVPQTQSVRLAKEVSTRNGATKLALHTGGNPAFYGTRDGQVRAHDLISRRTTIAHDGADGPVTALAVTNDAMVVAGTESGRVIRWIAGERSSASTVATGQSPVSGLAAIPSSNRVVATWSDGTAKLFDVGTNQLVRSYEVGGGPIHGVSISSDGESVAFATETRGAVVMSALSGEETEQLGEGLVTAVAFGAGRSQLAAGGAFGRVVVWKIGDSEIEKRLEGAGGRISTIVFSPDGTAVAAAVAGRPVVPVWKLSDSGE